MVYPQIAGAPILARETSKKDASLLTWPVTTPPPLAI